MNSNVDTDKQATVNLGDGDRIAIPAMEMPGFRTMKAIENKVERNLLFKTWGGLGDQICAEPTIRYAIKTFKDCSVSLASEIPEVFSHLRFKRSFDLKEEQPIWNRYFVFDTITSPDRLVWQFFSHCVVNCVDFPTLCALRSQLPIEDKEIHVAAQKPDDQTMLDIVASGSRHVLVHAGRHWPTKTFPKDWWDSVLRGLIDAGYVPVLIGADTDDNRGTVDVNPEGCLDLRNKTSVMECIWLCQHAKVLLTNDSSPLHMAATWNPLSPELSGKTWIGYIATCKHYDYITHWRRPSRADALPVFQWREENLGLGGIWDIVNHCPNAKEEITVDKVEEEQLRKWLPTPESVVEWAIHKMSS